MEPLALEPPAGLGGFQNALQEGGVKKWPPGGVDLRFTPPTHTYAISLGDTFDSLVE